MVHSNRMQPDRDHYRSKNCYRLRLSTGFKTMMGAEVITKAMIMMVPMTGVRGSKLFRVSKGQRTSSAYPSSSRYRPPRRPKAEGPQSHKSTAHKHVEQPNRPLQIHKLISRMRQASSASCIHFRAAATWRAFGYDQAFSRVTS